MAMNAGEFILEKNPERLLFDMPAVCRVTGFHRSSIVRKFRAGDFPPPRLIEGKYHWLRRDVVAWIEALPPAPEKEPA